MELAKRYSVPPASEPVVDLALEVARALHAYGAPAHRLEEALTRLAERLGVRGEFMSTPTALFASFGEGAAQRVALCRVAPGGTDLGKMADLDALLDAVVDGRLSTAEALLRVRSLVAAPPRHGRLLGALAFGGASAPAALFFGGGPWDVLVAGIIGVALGALAAASESSDLVARLFELLGGAVAASTAVVAAALGAPVSPTVATIAGVIVLVPGLSLTVAMTELATSNLASGSARLTGAFMSFAMVGAGVALGWQLERLFPATAEPGGALPAAWIAAGLLVAPACFAILMRARLRDIPWITLVCALGFSAARLAAEHLGPEPGAFAGALVIGVASHVYGRLSSRPVAVTLVPSLVLLVPGSLGFRSFTAFLASDTVAAMDTAFHTVLVAVALVTGLVVAQSVLPPRRAL